MSPIPTRVLLFSHDSQGLGHTRRNLALAHALADRLPRLTGRPVTGMLLSGLSEGIGPLPPGFDLVTLPGIRKGPAGYLPRRVALATDDVIQVRSRMLTAVITGFGPDLTIIDRHPYGVGGELREALAALRISRPGARLVLGLRDVLDDPKAMAREWDHLGDPNLLRETFDEIWAYGDPTIHDLRSSGELPLALRPIVHQTGLLAHGRRISATPAPTSTAVPVGAPYLLTMVGGGSDGAALCRIAAAAPVPRGLNHIVVTGPQMPEREHREVVNSARPATVVVSRVPDGLAAIRGATAVVSMAGYNSVAEILTTGVPALLVPREQPRREQAIRAAALARHGAVEVCRTDDLTVEALQRFWSGAVGRTVDRSGLDLRGLARVPQRAAALVNSAARTEVGDVAV